MGDKSVEERKLRGAAFVIGILQMLILSFQKHMLMLLVSQLFLDVGLEKSLGVEFGGAGVICVKEMRSEEQQIYEMRKHKSYGYEKCSACGFILRYCTVKSAKG